tara:strand:+ start:57 stop:287 length:231 start_codon:yes stop_codon:yes gene_type:complete
MAKYFEVDVIITKRIFVKAENLENCDSIQDYVYDIERCDEGNVTVYLPKQLTKQEDIDTSERHADKKIIDHTVDAF